MNNILGYFLILLSTIAVEGIPLEWIVGGSDAPAGKYPHQVSIRKYNSHFCGGSIINKRCILTAAHCVEGETPNNITVHAGTLLLNETGQSRNAKTLEHHQEFDIFFLENDVAVIILEKDLELSNNVQPIKISKKNITTENLPATLTGWGRTVVGGPLPVALQHINLKVIKREVCKAQQWRISESHICTLTKAGEGACHVIKIFHGDSGGPLISENEQIGIVSFGTPCARGKPDVFTRISTFYDWIDERCSKVA